MTTASSSHAARLARELLAKGVIDQSWAAAFVATPRDLFLPAFYRRSRDDTWELITPATVGHREWLELTYHDVTWVQRLNGPDHVSGPPACSCIQPSLAAQLLTALPTAPGARICEIGSGTGWLTALLSHRYGAGNVTGIELDPDLIRQARGPLSALGYQPQLICADGYNGHPDSAPYDAILSTAATTQVPQAWLKQTRPGGRIVTPIRGGIAVIDVKDQDNATGSFLPDPVQILPLRRPHEPAQDGTAARSELRDTDCGPVARALRNPHFRFVLGLRHPNLSVIDQGLPGELTVTDPSGSSIHVPALGKPEIHSASGLWQVMANAHLEWVEAGRPGPGNIALEIEEEGQWARVSTPSTTLRWQLR